MTQQKRHQVFLSYSRKDTSIMRHIRNTLTLNNIEAWSDEGINPGTELWQSAIQEAIENADAFIIMMSPDSKKSVWVGKEIHHAQIHQVRIFPLLLSGDERSSIPFSLSGTQFVNISQNYKLFDLQLIPELKSYLSQKMISRMEEQIAFLEEHIEELQENLEITTLRLNYLQMKNYESNASIIELTTLCNQLREERDIAIDHISNMSQKNFDSFDQNFSEVDT